MRCPEAGIICREYELEVPTLAFSLEHIGVDGDACSLR